MNEFFSFPFLSQNSLSIALNSSIPRFSHFLLQIDLTDKLNFLLYIFFPPFLFPFITQLFIRKADKKCFKAIINGNCYLERVRKVKHLMRSYKCKSYIRL